MQERIVFMGTPEFAVPALESLAERASDGELLVVTQPDRAAGRGRKLQSPAVKLAAKRLSLPFEQVATLRDGAIRDRLEQFAPDLVVVAAFGLLLPRWVLRLPPRGCINLHASLLPRFRGASPIAAAIASGDATTGVALMQMEAGLDTGAVYDVDAIDIAATDTTESLTERLAQVAAGLVERHIDGLLGGALRAEPQRGEIVETRKITKGHGQVAWDRPAIEIERQVRAMWPWPRAWTVTVDGTRLQVQRSEVVPGVIGEPGTVVASDDGGVIVATGDGGLRLVTVQLPGKTARPASELRSHPALSIGSRFAHAAELDPWIVPNGVAGS